MWRDEEEEDREEQKKRQGENKLLRVHLEIETSIGNPRNFDSLSPKLEIYRNVDKLPMN